MTKDIRLWGIEKNGNRLHEIQAPKLDQEARLQDWLEDDITMIADDLLVIGKEVGTLGGPLDLLCMDSEGDLVVVELKRNRTPRDVTAQVLDYASCIKDWPSDTVIEIANTYLFKRNGKQLDEVFKGRFRQQLPEVINESHRLLIVASEMDPSTERIINYLSDAYGVGINVMTFQYFKDETGNEFVGRVFLLDPSEERKGQTKKRRLSIDEFLRLADDNGISSLFIKALDLLQPLFDGYRTSMSTVSFVGNIGGSRRGFFSLLPGESNAENGLKYYIYLDYFAEYFGIEWTEECSKRFHASPWEAWRDAPPAVLGFLKSEEEIAGLAGLLGKT